MREGIREREKKRREKGKQRGMVDGETHQLGIPKATILSTVYALLKNVVILKKNLRPRVQLHARLESLLRRQIYHRAFFKCGLPPWHRF